jgi:hypothetical protein
VSGVHGNALAQTLIGLSVTEVISRQEPWRAIRAVEYNTLLLVDKFYQVRLPLAIDLLSPAVCEAQREAIPTGTALVPVDT